MKQLHEIQLGILKKLLFSPTLRYTEMKSEMRMDNNQFDFHLDSLTKAGLVVKVEGGYQLTQEGKEYANRMDTDSVKIIKQAKLGARVGCVRDSGGELEFLVYTRKKQPFFNCQGFLAGKINYGESVSGAAKRELLEETGLDGDPVLVEVEHMLVYDKSSGDLLEDKFFFFYLVKNPKGEVVSTEEGENYWVKESDLESQILNPFNSKEEFFYEVGLLKNFAGEVKFLEKKVYSEKF